MSVVDPHRLTTVDDVRSIIGPELPAIRQKLSGSLEPTAIEFIGRSPLLLFATADAEGRPDVSPKGDDPGFVAVEDEHTLVVPDRKGNRMILGLQNMLVNPHVALIFLVPGTEETLRVHGRAELTVDPALLDRLTARGQPAHLAVRVHVDTCFFHCAKAFKRSRLWQPETWPERLRISFGRLLAPKLGGGDKLAASIDRSIDEDYRTNL